MEDDEIIKSYINNNDLIKDKDKFYRIVKEHSEKSNIILYESLVQAYLYILHIAIKKEVMHEK